MALFNKFAPLDYVSIARLVIAVVMAVGYFVFWRRTRFWVPKYVHFLAVVGFIVSVWCMRTMPDEAPLNREGSVIKALFAFLLPAMVYFFFMFIGGQKEAFRNHIDKLKICPYCNSSLESLHERDDRDEKQCTYCGNLLYTSNQKPKNLK